MTPRADPPYSPHTMTDDLKCLVRETLDIQRRATGGRREILADVKHWIAGRGRLDDTTTEGDHSNEHARKHDAAQQRDR